MEHFKGFLATITCYTTGIFIPAFEQGKPDFITWALQNCAFIVTILIGLFSLIKSMYWLKDRRRHEKESEQTKD